jgi:dipeptidase D
MECIGWALTFADLVETSNNIAKVVLGEELSVQCLTRSSVETAKFDLANALTSAFELMGCEVVLSGSYPGWTQMQNQKSRCFSSYLWETRWENQEW